MRKVLQLVLLAALCAGGVGTVGAGIAYDRSGLGGDSVSAAMHLDPPPPGVDVRRPVSTDELYRKAGLERPARAGRAPAAGGTAPDAPSTAEGDAAGMAASVPAGTPALPMLAQHVEPSCTGTGADGNRVQLMYAYEKGRTNRLAEVELALRNEAANVDDVFAVSSAATGGGKRVRWVADALCKVSVIGVELPAGSLGTDPGTTFQAVRNKGYDRTDRKYLIFADAAQMCGVGEIYDDTRRTGNSNDGNVRHSMMARVDVNCWVSPRGYHSTAAHELVHNLGGIQNNAPNSSEGGHCNDESDVMCYEDGGTWDTMRQVCTTLEEPLLDCRKDDYFHTAPLPGSYLALNWNTADSSFLDTVAALSPSTAPGPYEATAIMLTVTGSNPATISGALVNTATRQPVAGARLAVRIRSQGSTLWSTTTARPITDSRGRFTASVTLFRSSYLQVVFDGSAALGPAYNTTPLARVG